jgi:hypothetical protein
MVILLQFIGPLQIQQQHLHRLPVNSHPFHHRHISLVYCKIQNHSLKLQCLRHFGNLARTNNMATCEAWEPM